jgi:hypothetical protein
MRDIRTDLQERANLIQGQVQAAYAHFEKAMQQMQVERDAKIAELTETPAMINKVMQFESGIVDNVVTLPPSPDANPSAKKPSLVDRIGPPSSYG